MEAVLVAEVGGAAAVGLGRGARGGGESDGPVLAAGPLALHALKALGLLAALRVSVHLPSPASQAQAMIEGEWRVTKSLHSLVPLRLAKCQQPLRRAGQTRVVKGAAVVFRQGVVAGVVGACASFPAPSNVASSGGSSGLR